MSATEMHERAASDLVAIIAREASLALLATYGIAAAPTADEIDEALRARHELDRRLSVLPT